MFVPIINEKHWTLLVANMKTKRWDFMDSIPKATHKAIAPEVISHLYDDAKDAFEDDIRTWPIQAIPNLPAQDNNVDCGMFVCKYMKQVIQNNNIDWDIHKNWQSNMALFRAEFAYAIFCSTIR
ncbi:Putative ubiquitin-like-specific protease 1B [Dendrobium catenatum]|uniref:Ubiquitin-like-specific protease 1B n=1 Tax=Dendrobium catenatum TaxID=906689 RepID=A0A2I0WPP9_9ASPA|nr:Putative ubiquitin-like-specific protease 1B [Dendrobium catenatum]